MKTKITNIGSIVTWSEEDQKVIKLENRLGIGRAQPHIQHF